MDFDTSHRVRHNEPTFENVRVRVKVLIICQKGG